MMLTLKACNLLQGPGQMRVWIDLILILILQGSRLMDLHMLTEEVVRENSLRENAHHDGPARQMAQERTEAQSQATADYVAQGNEDHADGVEQPGDTSQQARQKPPAPVEKTEEEKEDEELQEAVADDGAVRCCTSEACCR